MGLEAVTAQQTAQLEAVQDEWQERWETDTEALGLELTNVCAECDVLKETEEKLNHEIEILKQKIPEDDIMQQINYYKMKCQAQEDDMCALEDALDDANATLSAAGMKT